MPDALPHDRVARIRLELTEAAKAMALNGETQAAAEAMLLALLEVLLKKVLRSAYTSTLPPPLSENMFGLGVTRGPITEKQRAAHGTTIFNRKK